MALYIGSKLVSQKINTGDKVESPLYNLFDFKWTDHLLTDPGWINANNFEWIDGTVYTNAFNELFNEYQNTSSTNETEDTISYKCTPKGFKIALNDQETSITTKYNDKGLAWYYILDIINKKFKLPRTKYGFEGLRDSVGKDIEESLPNIRGQLDASGISNLSLSGTGVFDGTNYTSGGNTFGGQGTENTTHILFSASNSSSVYQDNTHVQEYATQMYLYFYVTDSVRTELNTDLSEFINQTKAALDTKQDSLPTLSSGKFLTNNGSTLSWGDAIVNNNSSKSTAIGILGTAQQTGNIIIGYGATDTSVDAGSNSVVTIGYNAKSGYSRSVAIGANTISNGGVAIGYNAHTDGTHSGQTVIGEGASSGAANTCAVGANAQAYGIYSSSYGYFARATAESSIQLGYGRNSEANTFYVGLSSSNNYKLLGSDGKIPSERLNDTVQAKLTAGNFINIDTNNKITTTYTAGSGIAISDTGVISNTQTSAEWGNITGTLSNQTDLQTALDAKQAKGNYVTIDTTQTVTGIKTFQQGSDTALIKVQNSTTALGVTPIAEKTAQIRLDDKNGDWIGLVSGKVETNGSTSVELCVRKPDKSGSGFISVDSDSSGNITLNASDGVKTSIKSWVPALLIKEW